MQVKKLHISLAVIATGLVFVGDLIASAEMPLVQGTPLTSKGVELLKTQAVDLGQEIPGMAGWQLRLRLLRIAPGGQTQVHSHRGRPAAFYVIEGATTVVYGDGTAERYSAGGTGYANQKTVHWHRNNESVPAVFLTTDIYQSSEM